MSFGRVKRISENFLFVGAGVLESALSVMEGLIYQIHFRVPNFINNVTATLTLEDEDGYEVYNSGAKNRNTNTNIYPNPPQLLAGNFTMKVTLSGAHGGIAAPASADATVAAVILYRGPY